MNVMASRARGSVRPDGRGSLCAVHLEWGDYHSQPVSSLPNSFQEAGSWAAKDSLTPSARAQTLAQDDPMIRSATLFAALLTLTGQQAIARSPAPVATVPSLTSMSSVAMPVPAPESQGKSKRELRAELKKKVSAAKKDAEKLFALALWAKRKGLDIDSVRLLRKVIKLNPDHKDARERLGFVQHKGKWVTKKALETLQKKAMEAEYKKRGWVKHKGEWIDPKELKYAKLGYSKDKEGAWIRKKDKERFAHGYVHHPEIGIWIKKGDLEKAEAGQVPVQGKWMSLADADKQHQSWESPWVIVEDDFILVTDLPYAEAEKRVTELSSALISIKGLAWTPSLPLPKRVPIFCFAKQADYVDFGAQYDESGFSSFGAFYANNHDKAPIAINYEAPGWNAYYLKHAMGLGVSAYLFTNVGIPATSWLHTGLGSYIECWANRGHAQHFGKQFLQKGGPRKFKDFWSSFTISADIDIDSVNRNIYQAGIPFSFLIKEPKKSKKIMKAWEELKSAAMDSDEKAAKKSLRRFEKAIQAREADIRAHLTQLVRG